MNYIEALTIITVLLTFCYASVLDVKTRYIPFKVWYPMIVICTILTTISIILYHDISTILLSLFLVTIFYILGIFNIFHGADVWAFSWIFIFVVIPFNLGIAEIISIILQAGIIGIITCVLIYVKKKKWDSIPFIPSITASLIYFFAFGTPL